MSNLKRKLFNLLIFVLILIVFLQPLQSCGAEKTENKDETANENEKATSENDSVESEPDEKSDEISDGLPALNFNGETVNIIYRDYMAYETYAEAESDEVISDAVYKRNMAIEERFNIKFNFIEVQGAWDHKDQFLKRIRNTVAAGDDEFDIIEGYAAYILELTTDGYLNNWWDMPYVDLDKPWWYQDFISEMTVNNKLFFLTGDLALSTIHMANALFFNKNLWKAYALDDPYAIVKEGKWTVDRMEEFTKQVTMDVDSNGKYDEKDLYGYVTDVHNQMDAYVIALDIPITVKGDDGLPEFVINDERLINGFMRIYAFVNDNVSTFAGQLQPTATDIFSMYREPIFQQERALILAEYLGNSSLMRGYDFDFGILPFPKLDDNQEKYKTMPQNGYTMFCTPVTVQNTEKVGAVIEALAAESRKSVVPAFYDVALKTKYARDEESSEMIDIIRDGISYNFGIEYAWMLGGSHPFRELIGSKSPNVASWVEKNTPRLEKSLAKILTVYEE